MKKIDSSTRVVRRLQPCGSGHRAGQARRPGGGREAAEAAPAAPPRPRPLRHPLRQPPAAAPAPAAPTAPELVDTRKINSGDTAWMLTSTALVLLMTIPGLALFYGGMVRKKNVLATLMQSFAITCLVTVLWVVAGYSLAFTPGRTFIGGLSRFFLHRHGLPERSRQGHRERTSVSPFPSRCS